MITGRALMRIFLDRGEELIIEGFDILHVEHRAEDESVRVVCPALDNSDDEEEETD